MEKRKSGPACQLVAFCLAAVMPAWGAGSGSERLAFPLEEVSGFDVADVGHTCACRSEPEPNVAYPAFTSAKPLYGVMCVDMEFANLRSGTPYHFALDESGGTGTGYDRLYLDHNRDGRLSDEAPIAPLRERPIPRRALPGRLGDNRVRRGRMVPAEGFVLRVVARQGENPAHRAAGSVRHAPAQRRPGDLDDHGYL
jgi:hypothetical protein